MCHIIKILGGGVGRDEREGNGRLGQRGENARSQPDASDNSEGFFLVRILCAFPPLDFTSLALSHQIEPSCAQNRVPLLQIED